MDPLELLQMKKFFGFEAKIVSCGVSNRLCSCLLGGNCQSSSDERIFKDNNLSLFVHMCV